MLQAISSLFENNVMKNECLGNDLAEDLEYRFNTMYTEPVDLALKRNMSVLEQLYKMYSGKFNLPGEYPKTISFKEWEQFCADSSITDLGFIDRNVRVVFVKSVHTGVDECGDKGSRMMNFAEFCHGLCWIASMIEPGKDLASSVQKFITGLGKLTNKKMERKLQQKDSAMSLPIDEN